MDLFVLSQHLTCLKRAEVVLLSLPYHQKKIKTSVTRKTPIITQHYSVASLKSAFQVCQVSITSETCWDRLGDVLNCLVSSLNDSMWQIFLLDLKCGVGKTPTGKSPVIYSKSTKPFSFWWGWTHHILDTDHGTVSPEVQRISLPSSLTFPITYSLLVTLTEAIVCINSTFVLKNTKHLPDFGSKWGTKRKEEEFFDSPWPLCTNVCFPGNGRDQRTEMQGMFQSLRVQLYNRMRAAAEHRNLPSSLQRYE